MLQWQIFCLFLKLHKLSIDLRLRVQRQGFAKEAATRDQSNRPTQIVQDHEGAHAGEAQRIAIKGL